MLSILFNLETDDVIENWPAIMACHCKTLSTFYQNVVIVVINHSKKDKGDMYLGTDETGESHATKVDQVYQFVLCL